MRVQYSEDVITALPDFLLFMTIIQKSWAIILIAQLFIFYNMQLMYDVIPRLYS